ncbi:MAG: DUF2802 domain-containing protein [Betaproteobacteria bacterium]|nr:DUF2802 domain-containing protein [Betaproteobacteria bacterium]
MDAWNWRDAVLMVIGILALFVGYAMMRLLLMARSAAGTSAGGGPQGTAAGVAAELQQLRREIAQLRDEVERLKTAPGVSPQYQDAMRLAASGADAQSIAERCGISLGEAELVRALSQPPRT